MTPEGKRWFPLERTQQNAYQGGGAPLAAGLGVVELADGAAGTLGRIGLRTLRSPGRVRCLRQGRAHQ